MEPSVKARNELLPKIIDLSERLQVFAWGLQNYYVDVYLTSDSSRSLEQMNYKNRKYRANTDIEELQEEISKHRKQFGGNNEDINSACRKLDASVQNYHDSCTLVDGTYILQAAARDLKSLKYVDAIVSLKELHKRLDKIECQGNSNLITAMRSFRSISETQLAISQGQLSVEFANLFKWNFHRGVQTQRYFMTVQQNDPILLERVFKALYIADQLIIEFQPFSEYFVNLLLPTIIKHNCDIYTEDKVGALEFNIKVNLQDSEIPNIPTIFNNLTAVFEFLATTMGSKLDEEKSLFHCLGDCNRKDFFDVLIENCIQNKLPYDERSYQAYKETALELDTFNRFLIDIHYVQALKSPLKKYIENTDLLYYETKCKRMLSEVRELMKHYLGGAAVTVGTVPDAHDASILDVTNKQFKYDLDTPLFFPKCMVTQSVRKIAAIITSCLEDSARLPMEYANMLVPYVKGIAVMYPGMVIQKNGDRLKTHAFEIGLFFNNCQYLAHTLIGPPWKNVLPTVIANQINTTLMSHIYDLRVIGLEKMSLFLKRNRDQIFTVIGGTSRNWHQQAFEAFNRDVNMILCQLRHLRESWDEVLPSRMYSKAMLVLVESTAEAMVLRALRYVDDITEDVVCLIASRFQYAIEDLLEVYPDISEMNPKIKIWEKFILIPKLFTAQLLEISRMWNDPRILKNKYTCDEVRLIIKMRFPSSDYRLKVLQGIQ